MLDEAKLSGKLCIVCNKYHCYWCGSYIVDVRDHFPSTSTIKQYSPEQIKIIRLTLYVGHPKTSYNFWVPACKSCDSKRQNDNTWLAYHDKEVGLKPGKPQYSIGYY